MSKQTGRKSKFEELQIVERYSSLSEPFFKLLEQYLKSKNKSDQRFAIEQLSKAFPKMIPTQISGVEGNPGSLGLKPMRRRKPKTKQEKRIYSGY